MSSSWRLRCPADDSVGPDLHRNAGGAGIDSDAWREFLGEHEFCGPLVLCGEGYMHEPLGRLLNLLLISAAEEPEPLLPPTKQGGVIPVALLWHATGLSDEVGRSYADLEAMVADLLAWVKLGAMESFGPGKDGGE